MGHYSLVALEAVPVVVVLPHHDGLVPDDLLALGAPAWDVQVLVMHVAADVKLEIFLNPFVPGQDENIVNGLTVNQYIQKLYS